MKALRSLLLSAIAVTTLLLSATAIAAQVDLLGSGSPSPTVSPETEPSPTPIPISEVINAAEEVDRRLETGESRIAQDNTVEEVTRSLSDQASDVSRLSADTKLLLAQIPSLEALESLEEEWRGLSGPVSGWKARLQSLSDDISDQLKSLENTLELWNQLNASVAGGSGSQDAEALESPSSVPASVRARIGEVIRSVEAARERLTEKRRSVLSLQARVSERENRIEELRSQIRRERDEALANLLQKDYPSVWEAGAFEGNLGRDVTRSFNELYAELYAYAREHTTSIVVHLLLTLLFIGLLFVVRRKAVELIEEEPKLRRAVSVFAVPVATGFLLSIALSGFFYPRAPALLEAILAAAILIPGYLVLERIVQRPLVPSLRAIVVVFFFDAFSDLFIAYPYILRTLLILETTVVLALLVWLFRTQQGIDADRPDHSRISKILHAIVPFAAIPFAVSLVANAFGFVSLARLLAEGMLESAYLALLIYALYMVVDGLILFAFRVRPLSDLMMVRNHGDALHGRVSRFFRWIAIVLWLALLLSNLYLLTPLVQRVGEVLTADLAIGSLVFSISDILLFVITVWLAFVLSKLTRFVLEEDIYPRAGVPGGVGYAVSTILHYLVLLAGFFIAISAVGTDLTRFAILAGAFGVGLGFGLQNIVNNFVSGIILLFERPFNVGDMIQVGDNTGNLKSIGLRASIVSTPEGADVIVPNGQLLSEEVTNWMAADQLKRLDIFVGVKYGTDPNEVMRLLAEVGNSHEGILEEPPPQILFVGFGDNSIDFHLKVWADNESRWWITRSDLYIGVYNALNDAGIEIPFPQRDLHIKSDEKSASGLTEKAPEDGE
ncbi:MAG: hypothetical protein DWQ47_10455 [Acidobacteria bacterium]|nr:MAG: hypothetical protein DWQ32_12870 [Acidobacteriota bacterium]REJ98006.1 MAG: hypothetical protein DWQ38_15670 [Acidobacteriota bacterium]REK16749.1 MAG: hypothetical protein DWQ43_00715 [Acidobacteriota bacterium]REK42660.1 MAG: hypothetical protein DWQ47_10455 [Acidobacteriota bacterium]